MATKPAFTARRCEREFGVSLNPEATFIGNTADQVSALKAKETQAITDIVEAWRLRLTAHFTSGAVLNVEICPEFCIEALVRIVAERGGYVERLNVV